MQINHFDDLKDAGLAQGEPQRLLIVLLRAEPAAGGNAVTRKGITKGRGTLTPVMATDLELTPELTFTAIVEEADSVGEPWQMMLVSSLAGGQGRSPTSEEASGPLQRMADAVATGGDISQYAAFDRAGSPVRLQAEA